MIKREEAWSNTAKQNKNDVSGINEAQKTQSFKSLDRSTRKERARERQQGHTVPYEAKFLVSRVWSSTGNSTGNIGVCVGRQNSIPGSRMGPGGPGLPLFSAHHGTSCRLYVPIEYGWQKHQLIGHTPSTYRRVFCCMFVSRDRQALGFQEAFS